MNDRNHHDRIKTIENGVSMVVPNSKFDLPTAPKAGPNPKAGKIFERLCTMNKAGC